MRSYFWRVFLLSKKYIMIQKLESIIEGKGEVKGIVFHQMVKENDFYIYKAVQGNKIYYEFFERRKTPICIDFEKRIYSEKDFKEVYPKSNDFGIWAFTANDWPAAKKGAKRFLKEGVDNG